jgi:hypothetical protein
MGRLTQGYKQEKGTHTMRYISVHELPKGRRATYLRLVEEAFGRRPWFVDLGDLNGKMYVPFFAAVPAFLAFILVFLDNGITLHLISHPSHKLTHGVAYNLNTLVIGLMVGINSMLGFPWLVAATVRSLSHLHALADKTENLKAFSKRG